MALSNPVKAIILPLVTLTLVIAGGCAPNIPKLSGDKELFVFLEPGISRETVLMKLGIPSASFEQGRILTYRVGGDEEKGYLLLDRRVLQGHWGAVSHSLVIVFDEEGFLAKHKLVKVQ